MADINLTALKKRDSHSDAPGDAPGAEPMWDLIELLFFAYRDFVGDPDDVLAKLGFGRAHHRVLHFVNRNPGMKVADLLDILRITKQSLGRVLKQLVDEGYVVQKEGERDRRQRLLYVTDKGEALAMKLASAPRSDGKGLTRRPEAQAESNANSSSCCFHFAEIFHQSVSVGRRAIPDF